MNDELKPCPFCGGEAKIEDALDLHFGRRKMIVCQSCNHVFHFATDSAKWNTRPIEDALRSELAQARASNTALNDQNVWLAKQNIALRADLAAARARIEQLEAERRWVPVGERLPEDKQLCRK